MILSFSWLIETGTSRTLCFFTTKASCNQCSRSVLHCAALTSVSIGHTSTRKNPSNHFMDALLVQIFYLFFRFILKELWVILPERGGRDSLWLCTLFSSEDQEWSWRLKNKEIFSFNKCRSWDISELVLNSSKFWSSVVKRPGTSVPSRY